MAMTKKFTATIPCRNCGAEIGFVVKETGKKLPVEADSLSEEDLEMMERRQPVDYRYEDHQPHWKTCPDAEEFRQSINYQGGRT